MITGINLSYVLTTRNRLPFLKITLQKLLEQLQPDEEVVVVDAESTDGTQNYLSQLLGEGKIHQYLSEPDRNQGHGWNKAMLMAKGVLIKKIIDDDVFCYSAIRQCKNYMLQHPLVDVVISNDLLSLLDNHKLIKENTRLPQFKRWCQGTISSFTFGDVHMLIKRTSLAYIGIYNTAFTMIDWEYSLRISYNKANIVYYTGYNALSIGHPQTVTSKVHKAILQAEGKIGRILYKYAGDDSEISNWSKIKIFAGRTIYGKKQQVTIKATVIENKSLQDIYAHYYQHINTLSIIDAQFLDINTI